MPTYCDQCRHVFVPHKGATSRQLLCLKHKRLSGMGFVSEGIWVNDPPYLHCHQVNAGACPLWEEANEKQIKMDGVK